MGFKSLAKKLNRITESKNIRDAAMALVSNKKDSQELQRAYQAMTVAYSPFESLGLHFNLLRTDGRMVYSSENTLDQIKVMTENYGQKPEVNHALKGYYGFRFNDLELEINNKRRLQKGAKALLKTGYGLATRYGFASGDLENFVAKLITPTGTNIPSGYDCIARVSEKKRTIN